MQFLRRYRFVIAWSGVIFFFSSLTTPPTPQDTILNFLLKKSAHVIEYAILYWLTWKATNEQRSKKDFLGPFLFTMLYAASDEIHQAFVPGRHARYYDLGFNALGAWLAIWRIRRRR